MRTRNTRGTVAPLAIALAAIGFLACGVEQAFAQTPYVPYYGKNRIRYNDFKWKIYTTDHFEMYYYPDLEPQLERVASYAESAYQQVSSDLKHDLAFKVPMVLYKTQSEFQQQNIIPGELPEGVLAFAEHYRDRMVMPIDEPSDALYRLITHELTHIFEFDIIPRSLLRRGLPLWVDEGLADYMTGYWQPFDLMSVRDAAIADIVPPMSDFQGVQFADGRLPYNLGHAAFEFIESRWGKEGLRQFLFALRKAVIGGGESAYEEAFKLKAEEFDEQFEKYLKDRFKPFRDKERPVDYGRNLAPKRGKTQYSVVVSIEPSPSGDLMAVAAGNGKDQELDIILMSTKDGKVIRNLTSGFNKDRGYEYISTPGGFRNNAVSWMSWAPTGDRVGYFARTEKIKTLILQNVVTRNIEKRVEIKTVDTPESPDISPDGREVAFAGLRGAIGDIFIVNVDTGDVRNLTNDQFGDYAPTFAPDGKSIVYLARVSGNDKLFRVDLATGVKTQLTFGTHDDGGAQFVDANTIVFPSTAVDPNQPIDPEVARNGNIYNIWTLSLDNGELKQYTDALTGNVSPIVLRDQKTPRIAFVTYYKGEYGIHTLARQEPLNTVASADFGSPGPIIDFQAPITHTLVQSNIKTKGTFEKLFLEGRPPVNVGVTSGGDLFGGTQVTFTDVLGDKQFNLYASSVSQYRTMSFSYTNLSRRLQYAFQAYSQTQFYYGYDPGLLYGAQYAFVDRDDAIATQTARGATAYGIYPFNRYARIELSGGLFQFNQGYNDQGLQQVADQYQIQQYGRTLFANGSIMPIGATYVQETTVFREYGPLAGNTIRAGYEYAPSLGNLLSRHTVDADARYYMRLATNGVLAFRARGFKSWGEFPGYMYFGGNSELRGYEYLEFLGNKAFFLNAELRFPLIEAALTPLGVIGGLRGVAFANAGAAGYEGVPMKVYSRDVLTVTPLLGFEPNFQEQRFDPVFGPPANIGGLKLVDGRASYGVGLETFALGFPIHFDWSWRTLLNKEYEDYIFAYQGITEGTTGSKWFRKPRFSMWIGYDF
jgi:Tol biopolymer transport system component